MGMMPKSGKLAIFNPLVWIGIIIFGLFGAFWVWIVLPWMTNTPSFYTLNPLVAYPLYNLGVYLMTLAIFGYLLGAIIYGQRFTLFKAFSLGSFAFFNFSFILDNVFWGPYYLSSQGQVLVPLGTPSLEVASVDAFSAQMWVTLLPWIQGTPLWYGLTYYATAIIVLVLTSAMVTASVFMKGITQL